MGPVSLVRPAHGIAAQKTADYLAPPLLGQHTEAVLRDVLGYSEEAIEGLLDSGTISVAALQPSD